MGATTPDLLTALGVADREARPAGLSVCCMSCSRDPARLAAVLAPLRRVADEVVIALDERRAEAAAPFLGDVADRVLSFKRSEHPDRPIPWLFESCRYRWVFNVDDDEVASPALVDTLPSLVAADDVSHYWIARRWLFGDRSRAIVDAPWGLEYQLRLVRLDVGLVQYSDEFHRPVVASGPSRYVEQPLWHLDLLVNAYERRRAKAERYERRRRGMRIAGVAHNSGFYLPELRAGLRTEDVPARDLAAIDEVLNASVRPGAPVRVEQPDPDAVSALWPASRRSRARGLVEVVRAPSFFSAGVQQTVDVRVTNLGRRTWGWGKEARPEIRLAYRWHGPADDPRSLRTPLPAPLAPGASQIVPLHVAAPRLPGRYRLELDLVHEHVRWFGCGVTLDVEIRARRRVAVACAPERLDEILDALALVPELEPVVVRADGRSTPGFEHPQAPGPVLFPPDEAGSRRAVELVRNAARSVTAVADARRHRPTTPFLATIADCEALVVAGLDAEPDAPRTRALWRRALTAQSARAAGVRVIVVDGELARGGVDGAVDRMFVRGAERASADELPLLLA